WRLFHQGFPWIGAAGAVHFHSCDDVARFQSGSGEADYDGELGDPGFPITLIFLGIFWHFSQDLASGDFRLPLTESEFIRGDQIQGSPFERAIDGFAINLLPPRASFLVAHQEILVVDARQIKMQRSAVYGAGPHETRVTERSIGDGDR